MVLVKRYKRFLQRINEAHRKFARELKKIGQEEGARLTAMTPMDKMHSCRDALLFVIQDCESMAIAHESFGLNIENTVIPPVDRFCMIGSDIQERSEKKHKSCLAAYDGAISALNKTKREAQGLIDGIASKASKIRDQKQRAGRLGRDYDRLKDAVNNYKLQLGSAKRLQKKHMKDDIPEILTHLQGMEEMRMNNLRSTLNSHSSRMSEFANTYHKIANDMKHVSDRINTWDNLNNFAANLSAVRDNRYPSLGWELSKSDDEVQLDHLRHRAETKGGGLFHSTMEDIMKLERATHPELHVPSLLTALITKLEELGGYQTEGIFRLSASQSTLKSLRIRVEQGDFSMRDIRSPHVPAGLLKEWLRGLKEVIIPDSLYDKCISLCETLEREGGKMGPQSRQQLLNIFKKVPEVNLRVLKIIVKLILVISHPLNVEKTKMTEKNMAIVFAPSILRNHSKDPQCLLKNSKYEIQFSQLCVAELGKDLQPEVNATVIAGCATSMTATHPVSGGSSAARSPTSARSNSAVLGQNLVWTEHEDPATGRSYFYNNITQESRWEPPGR